MKFELPTTSKERIDTLLSYLGDRADDFKKCFNVQSEYCLMYADLMLRGMETRDLEYGERHHIVPYCFYKMKKPNCTRSCKYVSYNNMTCLTYQEHAYAHYCAAQCGIGDIKWKMANAFLRMYNRAKYMPTNCEVISLISSEEFENTRKLIPHIAKVESEGRTHSWEDPVKARQDWYNANKEEILSKDKAYKALHKEEYKKRHKEYYENNKEALLARGKERYEERKEEIKSNRKAYYYSNKEKCSESTRKYHEKNKDKIREWQKAYTEANKDKIDAYQISYREAHRDEKKVYDKQYYQANKERKLEYRRSYRETNKDLILSRVKKYREAHLEECKKKCREYHASHKEEQHAKQAEYREAKRAAGYRYRKNPVTGKHEWMFVGVKTEAA